MRNFFQNILWSEKLPALCGPFIPISLSEFNKRFSSWRTATLCIFFMVVFHGPEANAIDAHNPSPNDSGQTILACLSMFQSSDLLKKMSTSVSHFHCQLIKGFLILHHYAWESANATKKCLES